MSPQIYLPGNLLTCKDCSLLQAGVYEKHDLTTSNGMSAYPCALRISAREQLPRNCNCDRRSSSRSDGLKIEKKMPGTS